MEKAFCWLCNHCVSKRSYGLSSTEFIENDEQPAATLQNELTRLLGDQALDEGYGIKEGEDQEDQRLICRKCYQLIGDIRNHERQLRIMMVELCSTFRNAMEYRKQLAEQAVTDEAKKCEEPSLPSFEFPSPKKQRVEETVRPDPHGQFRCSGVGCDDLPFATKRDLHIHMRGAHSLYVCRLLDCNEVLASMHILNIHGRKHERNKNNADFQCEVCPKAFPTHRQLIHHDRTHFGRQFKCEKCDKSFILPSQLMTHMKTHSEHRSFACDHCDKRFLTLQTLKNHKQIHNDKRVKNHACVICGRAFFTRGQLTSHLDTHVTENKYNCDHCGKSYKSDKLLKQHLTTHTALKKFECTFEENGVTCGKRFLRNADLVIHTRCHTGEKPFVCHQCGKNFGNPSNMIAHVKQTHNKVIQNTCEVCGQGFKRKRLLMQHMANEHGAGQASTTTVEQILEIPTTSLGELAEVSTDLENTLVYLVKEDGTTSEQVILPAAAEQDGGQDGVQYGVQYQLVETGDSEKENNYVVIEVGEQN